MLPVRSDSIGLGSTIRTDDAKLGSTIRVDEGDGKLLPTFDGLTVDREEELEDEELEDELLEYEECDAELLNRNCLTADVY